MSTSSRSKPVFIDQVEGQSFVQVLRASSVNDHIIIGSRQAVRTAVINENCSGLTTVRSMKSSSSATTAVAFHPTAESVFVSAASNGEVSVWYYGALNVAPLYERWPAHARAIHAMEFFPKPVTRQKSTTFPGHQDAESVMLLTAGADGELNCWDLCSYPPGVQKWRKPCLVGNLRSAGLRSGIRDLDIVVRAEVYSVIVATEDGAIEYYESLSLNPLTLGLKSRISVSTQTVNSVRFDLTSVTGNELRLAIGGKDTYVRLFSVYSKGQLNPQSTIRSQGPVWAVRWRPGGRYIATSQSVMDSNIYVWDLESRLMPAYVFNSHRDNVTDFFWADRFHILSCSRDNSVQMHAIKNAVIPIERMRTVNISFTVDRAGRQTLTSVCDIVNRTRFEKSHAEMDLELMRLGFPVSEHLTAFSPQSGGTDDIISISETKHVNRIAKIRAVRMGKGFTVNSAWLGKLAKPLTLFVKEIAKLTEVTEVGNSCILFSEKLRKIGSSLEAQAETLRLLGWLLLQPASSVLPLFVSKALESFQEANDVVMVIAIGAVALFSPNPLLTAFMSSSKFVKINIAFLEVLRRLELWQAAAEHVFHSPIAEIRSISHMRTGIHIACVNCRREQEGVSALCVKCNSRLADCVLCGNQVKGLWTACEGCGHGGHAKHMDWWFDRYNVCPVPDCLHQCP